MRSEFTMAVTPATLPPPGMAFMVDLVREVLSTGHAALSFIEVEDLPDWQEAPQANPATEVVAIAAMATNTAKMVGARNLGLSCFFISTPPIQAMRMGVFNLSAGWLHLPTVVLPAGHGG